MALIKCPKCGETISDRGVICPNCHFLFKNKSALEKPSKVFLIQGFITLVIAIALLIFGFWAISSGGIIFVILGFFVFVVACFSFNEYIKDVYKHHLANTDYTAYQEYIEKERQKERETQEFLQKQKEEKPQRNIIITSINALCVALIKL